MQCNSALDGEIRDGRHVHGGAGLLRGHRLSPASSITQAICASWSAGAPTICGFSVPISARCSRRPSREAPGFAFVVRSMQIEFLKPARMDDVLEMSQRRKRCSGASITLHQRVMRGDDLLVEAHVQVAFVSGGRARRIPEPLRTAMGADQEPRHKASGLSTTRSAQCKYPSHELETWRREGGPRGYHHGNLKEALMRAALELIAKNGPAGSPSRKPRAGQASVLQRPIATFAIVMSCLRALRCVVFSNSRLRSSAPGTMEGPILSWRSIGSARPISRLLAASLPITRPCSRPAFRSTPVRSWCRRATTPLACSGAPTDALIATMPARSGRRLA